MTAARLRTAAAKLREVAEGATPGPWTTPAGGDDDYIGPWDVVGPGEPGDRYIVCEHAGPDAAFIATMSPPVALAMAAWLEAEADAPPHFNFGLDGDGVRALQRKPSHALAVADAVLADQDVAV